MIESWYGWLYYTMYTIPEVLLLKSSPVLSPPGWCNYWHDSCLDIYGGALMRNLLRPLVSPALDRSTWFLILSNFSRLFAGVSEMDGIRVPAREKSSLFATFPVLHFADLKLILACEMSSFGNHQQPGTNVQVWFGWDQCRWGPARAHLVSSPFPCFPDQLCDYSKGQPKSQSKVELTINLPFTNDGLYIELPFRLDV